MVIFVLDSGAGDDLQGCCKFGWGGLSEYKRQTPCQ